jgi:hypothetical protein
VVHDFRRIMELVSEFSEVRSIYYEFFKGKPISEINKEFLEKGKIGNRDTWQHPGTCHVAC